MQWDISWSRGTGSSNLFSIRTSLDAPVCLKAYQKKSPFQLWVIPYFLIWLNITLIGLIPQSSSPYPVEYWLLVQVRWKRWQYDFKVNVHWVKLKYRGKTEDWTIEITPSSFSMNLYQWNSIIEIWLWLHELGTVVCSIISSMKLVYWDIREVLCWLLLMKVVLQDHN